MKKPFSTRTIILTVSLLQLSTFCFQSHGAAGDVDLSFDPGSGINGTVRTVAVQPDGEVLLGGSFDNIQGTNRNRIARLNADGSLDSTFDSGIGANADVNAVVLQADGKVLIGGSFSSVNNATRTSVARLNANGSLDHSFQPNLAMFNPGNGCPSSYSCEPPYPETTDILVQPDGKVLIGGTFITVAQGEEDIQYIYRYFLGRFHANSSHDPSFIPGINFSVGSAFLSALALQPDGNSLAVGCSPNAAGAEFIRVWRAPAILEIEESK